MVRRVRWLMLGARKEVEMTDQPGSDRDDEGTSQRRDWASEAEEALEGVGTALQEAWAASREARLSALESAKKAAQQLGEALEKGAAAARQKWEGEAKGDGVQDGGATVVHAPMMGPDDGRLEEE